MAGVAPQGTADIVVMRPSSYIVAEIVMTDYHFTIPSSPLPPTRINNKVYYLDRRRMIAFPPDCAAKCVESIPTRPYIAMNIKREFFNGIARAVTGRGAPFLSAYSYPYSPVLVDLIRGLEDEILTFGGSCRLMLQSMSTQIAIQILRAMGIRASDKSMPLDKSYVDLAMEYMMVYYNSNIRIEDICRQINISPYHFIRMFKDKTGITPHEFLQRVRIDKAVEMLKSGHYSVMETASLCGFVSADHFARSFKHAMGIPPSEFRRIYSISK